MDAGSRWPPFLAVNRTVDRRTHASSITDVTTRRSSAVTVWSPTVAFQMAFFARRSQGSGSAPCGLRIVGSGHFSSRPPGLATLPPGSRYQGEEGGTDGGATVLKAGEGDACLVDRTVFDSQRAGGYSPLDFPPSGGLCWASWRHSKTRGEGGLVRGGAPGPARIRHAG